MSRTTQERPRVSVVCPLYNEEVIIVDAARRTVAGLVRDFGNDWELVLVNDGSLDNSLPRLREAVADLALPNVRILSYATNHGRGRALKTGIDAAAGDIIVTTEADGSWGDDIVLRLVQRLDSEPAADFVIASPHLSGGGLVNVPTNRRFLTSAGNRLIRAFFTSSVSMNTGMTRAYRRDVIVPLQVVEDSKEFHLEVLLKLTTLGFRVREIPATITWPEDKARKHQQQRRRSSTKIGRTIGTHLRFLAIAQPVRQFAALAVLSLLVGVGFVSAAVVSLVLDRPAVFLAIIGLVMMLFALLFSGFSVLFFQFRDFMRDSWLTYYPPGSGPSTPKVQIFHFDMQSDRL